MRVRRELRCGSGRSGLAPRYKPTTHRSRAPQQKKPPPAGLLVGGGLALQGICNIGQPPSVRKLFLFRGLRCAWRLWKSSRNPFWERPTMRNTLPNRHPWEPHGWSASREPGRCVPVADLAVQPASEAAGNCHGVPSLSPQTNPSALAAWRQKPSVRSGIAWTWGTPRTRTFELPMPSLESQVNN